MGELEVALAVVILAEVVAALGLINFFRVAVEVAARPGILEVVAMGDAMARPVQAAEVVAG